MHGDHRLRQGLVKGGGQYTQRFCPDLLLSWCSPNLMACTHVDRHDDDQGELARQVERIPLNSQVFQMMRAVAGESRYAPAIIPLVVDHEAVDNL